MSFIRFCCLQMASRFLKSTSRYLCSCTYLMCGTAGSVVSRWTLYRSPKSCTRLPELHPEVWRPKTIEVLRFWFDFFRLMRKTLTLLFEDFFSINKKTRISYKERSVDSSRKNKNNKPRNLSQNSLLFSCVTSYFLMKFWHIQWVVYNIFVDCTVFSVS